MSQSFLGIEAGEWPQGASRTQPTHSGLDGAMGDQTGTKQGQKCCPITCFCPCSSPEHLALAPAWPVEIELSHEVLRILSTIGSVLSAK